MFGAGGELVEVLRDRALALPPLTTTLARRLVDETRIRARAARRSRPPAVDLDALASLLVRFGDLGRRSAADPRDRHQSAAGDAGRRGRAGCAHRPPQPAVADAELPRPAIRPTRGVRLDRDLARRRPLHHPPDPPDDEHADGGVSPDAVRRERPACDILHPSSWDDGPRTSGCSRDLLRRLRSRDRVGRRGALGVR
jgi:acetyltransferase